MIQNSTHPSVAVAGGGLAGLAAACALADCGFRITLFERRPYLGGRASSYEHPGTGEVIDNCQHVLFRVCTNLVEFYRRIGAEDKIRWFEDMTFVEPGGRASVMRASPLPAPLHTALSFLRFPFLDAADKLAISRAIAALTLKRQTDTGESFQDWCRRHGQTKAAMERFWKPILVSALSEDLDLISVSSAAQVVRESMKSPQARHMGVPTIPLTALYNLAGDYIRARGGEIRFRSSLETFSSAIASSPSPSQESSKVRIRAGQQDLAFDYLVLALPFDSIERVLPQTPEAAPLREKLAHFEPCPITGIHLWFDRQITDLDHAVLLDRTIQWMFHKSRLLATREAGHESSGSYIELVVSASKSLIEKSRTEIVDLALKEVREFFPGAREANLLKSTVIKEISAVYSPRPHTEKYRPPQVTAWPRVFLAGDWTDTGWPATMEGAVRSGYRAAEELCLVAGITDAGITDAGIKAAEMKPVRFVASDLPAAGLMRILGS